MLRNNLELNSGLVRFRSKESATAYLETLLQYYRSRQEEYAQQLADQLRTTQDSPRRKAESAKDSKKEKGGRQPSAQGWTKVGTLVVSSSDATGALAQVTLRITDDYRAKAEQVSEALKSFKDVDSLSQAGTRLYTLFVHRGVPEAVIVEDLARKADAFAFSASFRAV